MADLEPKVSPPPASSTTYPYPYPYPCLPWLGPEYSNDNINFDTQFQDWQMESPAVVLQEALAELWKRLVDGISAELGLGLSALPGSVSAAFHAAAGVTRPGSGSGSGSRSS
ncbi:hypothetical protein A1O3_09666 [Capronia epimyces CBS 606.96]|uniref:Uncharacterized protein n=1 Tax=Capronia epimyces CBS 606.96 TaxID=1182542 RepID=W9XJD0_9EURO|nr:uncharacterized protein A1O3_09666 [Capronia epimyces CBS 606.96]EXJ77440.1 hypothetical protein A1O3_09666 [Capronia epimyces CBS 606.96]